MSMRVILAGFALSLIATIFACYAVMRSKHAGRGLWWLIGGLVSALAGVFLFAARDQAPGISILLGNGAVVLAFVFFHQAVVSVLDSRRRYLSLSILLLSSNFLALSWFTFAAPNVRGRILARTSAILIQVAATCFALYRHKFAALREPIRMLLSVLLAFGLLQASRLVASCFTVPSVKPFDPDPVQAFFGLFTYMLGLGISFAIIWLALCAKRHGLQVLANTDSLSGLLNRRALDDILFRELQGRDRRAQHFALLLIDIDHFKVINDEYGHQAGDEVIRRVSQLLCANTRAIDAVARYGGEEFAMVLRGMQLDQAESIAERLRRQIEAMVGLPEAIRITASIGIAVKEPDDAVESLIRRCDMALYTSKNSGRNRVSTQDALVEYWPDAGLAR